LSEYVSLNLFVGVPGLHPHSSPHFAGPTSAQVSQNFPSSYFSQVITATM